MKKILAIAIGMALSSQVMASVDIKENHPSSYTVQKGDSLWSISGKFLTHPWEWKKVWTANKQIKNPDLIYPGDKVRLIMVNGKPMLTTEGGSGMHATNARKTIRLSPGIRKLEATVAPIQAIPSEKIAALVKEVRVLTSSEYKEAGYVTANEDGSVYSVMGDLSFAQYLPKNTTKFDVIRKRKVYYSEDTKKKEIIAVETLKIGEARLVRNGDKISTIEILSTSKGIERGDRLIAHEKPDDLLSFVPVIPDVIEKGEIIDVIGGVDYIGLYQTVTLNKGSVHGFKKGDVVTIIRQAKMVKDAKFKNKMVKLPNLSKGTAVVFKTHDYISYALIMEAKSSLKVGDEFSTTF